MEQSSEFHPKETFIKSLMWNIKISIYFAVHIPNSIWSKGAAKQTQVRECVRMRADAMRRRGAVALQSAPSVAPVQCATTLTLTENNREKQDPTKQNPVCFYFSFFCFFFSFVYLCVCCDCEIRNLVKFLNVFGVGNWFFWWCMCEGERRHFGNVKEKD